VISLWTLCKSYWRSLRRRYYYNGALIEVYPARLRFGECTRPTRDVQSSGEKGRLSLTGRLGIGADDDEHNEGGKE